MLARFPAARFVARTLVLLALLVLSAAPARAAGLGLRASFHARSRAFATHFSVHRARQARRRSAAPSPPVTPRRARRRHNGAEHARHVSTDKHTRKSATGTQATSPNAGIGNARRIEVAPVTLAFLSPSSDRLPATSRSSRTPSRAPPSSFLS
ncbi:MAG TPA: hypothetical protein VHZ73_01410 [Vicinamibacterales bacterium]|nr:hypothetical protein [Vicinamibacterales bacterium]